MDFIVHGDRSLLAFQGPKAVDVLQPLVSDVDLSKLYFGMFTEATINGAKCWLTRTGRGRELLHPPLTHDHVYVLLLNYLDDTVSSLSRRPTSDDLCALKINK